MRTAISILGTAGYALTIFVLLAMAAPHTQRTTVELGQAEVIAVETPPTLATGEACAPARKSG